MSSTEQSYPNADAYEAMYVKEEAFLRYPADWVIRFHNMYLKKTIPANARVLDYGCGSGNNAIFLMQKGYAVHGVDAAPTFKKLLLKNLALHGFDESAADTFNLISPEKTRLDFPDDHFDFILSNQVLYYMPSEEHLRKVCAELRRILKPGGCVFFTMMGPKNCYITHYLEKIHGDRIYEISIRDPKHRLYGVREQILITRDEADLCSLFDAFEPVTTGYFDQKMFDLHSNFHFLFVGKKPG